MEGPPNDTLLIFLLTALLKADINWLLLCFSVKTTRPSNTAHHQHANKGEMEHSLIPKLLGLQIVMTNLLILTSAASKLSKISTHVVHGFTDRRYSCSLRILY